ncbi:MAG: VanZ family protein [Candidatus Eisenbacteria bacterium]
MANHEVDRAGWGGIKRPLGFLARHRWLPMLAWAIAMFAVSSTPRLQFEVERFPGCDKVLHFIEYSILGITLRYWSARSGKFLVGGGIAFGALDELHQLWIPGRCASFWDLVADALGVTFGFVISRFFLRKEAI